MRAVVGSGMVLLMVSLLAVSAGVAQENDYRIVPGQRVGRFELGKPVGAFNVGQNSWQWRRVTGEGLPFIDASFFPGPNVLLYTCKTDGLVLMALVSRRLDAPDTDGEVVKYRTSKGVGIGTDEGEVIRLLGPPSHTGGEWVERHGAHEIRIRQIGYAGLVVQVNAGDRRAVAFGVEKPGAWGACERAVRTKPSAAMSGVPLPTDLRIVAPGPAVPVELAAYSGRWVGAWDRVLDHVLVVEEITPPSAVFVYAWGTAPQWDILRPGWVRARGAFVGGELQARLNGGVHVVYRRVPTVRGESVAATYERGGITARAMMVPVRE